MAQLLLYGVPKLGAHDLSEVADDLFDGLAVVAILREHSDGLGNDFAHGGPLIRVHFRFEGHEKVSDLDLSTIDAAGKASRLRYRGDAAHSSLCDAHAG